MEIKRKKGITIKFKYLKIATITFLIISMLSFFLTFVRGSFLGFSIEASGFEIATTISMHDDLEFSEDDSPDPFLIAAVIFNIVGIALVRYADERKRYKKYILYACGMAIVSFICLILFRINFERLAEEEGVANLVTIRYGSGWILSTLTCAGAAIAAFLAGGENIIAAFRASDTTQNTAQAVKASTYVLPKEEAISHSSDLGEQRTQTKLQPVSSLKVIVKARMESGEITEWVPDSFPCFIGRDTAQVHISIPDARVSKVHAMLYIEKDAVMILDEGSSNGTFVNGEKISGPVELLTGDEVQVGGTTLFFEVCEP